MSAFGEIATKEILSRGKWHEGPWAVDPDEREGMEFNNFIVIAAQPHMRICFMSHDGTPENEAAQASAHLIAAAPELFNALSAMAEFWAYGLDKPEGAKPTPEDDRRVEELAIMSLKALAQAKGLR